MLPVEVYDELMAKRQNAADQVAASLLHAEPLPARGLSRRSDTAGREPDERFQAVRLERVHGDAVRPREPALHAAVDDNLALARAVLEPDRPHQTAAHGRPLVSRRRRWG